MENFQFQHSVAQSKQFARRASSRSSRVTLHNFTKHTALHREAVSDPNWNHRPLLRLTHPPLLHQVFGRIKENPHRLHGEGFCLAPGSTAGAFWRFGGLREAQEANAAQAAARDRVALRNITKDTTLHRETVSDPN